MAVLRFTRELLEHILDLPEGVTIESFASTPVFVDGIPCIQMTVTGDEEPWSSDAALALAYEERESGVHLASVVPIE